MVKRACESSVLDSGTGRKVARCPEPARWILTRRFSGQKSVLCQGHMESTFRIGVHDLEPIGNAQR